MIENNAVVYDVVFPNSRERVWQALVRPGELAQWLMPSHGFQPVIGQRFTMTCDPFGAIDGQVLEVVPQRRLSFRWAGSFGDTIVTFDLLDDRGGTRLRVIHSGWDDASRGSRDQFDSGWNSKLGDSLAALLSHSRAVNGPARTP
jgi:uncharacterized protein YndB with AHSA1/START domain